MNELFKPHIQKLYNDPIVQKLLQHGRLFLVGGYIRSILGGEKPNDTDLFLLTSTDINIIADSIRSNKIHVSKTIKQDYEGRMLNDLRMMSIQRVEPLGYIYDVVACDTASKFGSDFDVNKMFIEISPTFEGIYTIKDDLVLMTDDEIAKMVDQIKAKLFNVIYTVDFLKKHERTVYGSAHLLQRFAKRVREGWVLTNNPNNIQVAVHILNTVYSQCYTRNIDQRNGTLTSIYLMDFLMTVGYDLKSFINEKYWDHGEVNTNQYYRDYKFKYFEKNLNFVANMMQDQFSFKRCKKLMDYCGVEFTNWPNVWKGWGSQTDAKYVDDE